MRQLNPKTDSNQSIQDLNVMDVLETFGSVSNLGKSPLSPVFNEDADGSFFGGGGA